jgi:hypothetical protein
MAEPSEDNGNGNVKITVAKLSEQLIAMDRRMADGFSSIKEVMSDGFKNINDDITGIANVNSDQETRIRRVEEWSTTSKERWYNHDEKDTQKWEAHNESHHRERGIMGLLALAFGGIMTYLGFRPPV